MEKRFTPPHKSFNLLSGLLLWSMTSMAQLSINALPKTVAGGYNISCNGGDDGQINTVVTGNTGPYTFAWGTSTPLSLTGVTTSTVSSLTAGAYWVTVTDSLNNVASDTVTLIQPSVLAASVNAHTFSGGTHISEHGAADGEMYSSVSGGIPPYTYLWQPPSTGSGQAHTEHTFKDVPAGDYDLTVTDAGGCTTEAGKTLTEPPVFAVQVDLVERENGTQITCAGGEDGSATATPTGGIPPYTYDWANDEEDSVATALKAGLQKVKVFDANGVKREVEFTLIAPDSIHIDITTTALFPNGYHTSCHNCNNATVTANVSGGLEPYEYLWAHTDYTTAVIQSAGEPEYELYLKDANGCKAKDKVKLRIPERDDWAVNGNSGLDAEGNPKWLGTSDSTDFVMKANGQPRLRVGADGVVEILGQFKISGLNATNGQPAAIGVDDNGLFGLLEPTLTPANCDETSSIGQWSYGLDKIVTFCNRTDVGIGMTEEEQPAAKLEVRGLAQAQGIKVGGAPNGQGLYENLQNSIVDIRGNTVIGYQDDIGPNSANATLDLRADGTTNGAALSVSDNAGQPTFRAYNDGRTVVGKSLGQNGDQATLHLGDENHYIKSTFGQGLSLSTYGAVDALKIAEGSGRVHIGGGDFTQASPPIEHEIKLSVKGAIVAKEVYVVTDYWADFVFRPEYKLRTLQEEERLIKQLGHLPDVPSEKEILETGVPLGQMDATLLRKVEELTLHLIEMDKRMRVLEEENARLRGSIIND